MIEVQELQKFELQFTYQAINLWIIALGSIILMLILMFWQSMIMKQEDQQAFEEYFQLTHSIPVTYQSRFVR